MWSDATWGTEADRTSIYGWIVIRHRGAVSWKSAKQKSRSISSIEAELFVASEAGRETAWLEKVAKALEEVSKVLYIPTLYIDNSLYVAIIENPRFF